MAQVGSVAGDAERNKAIARSWTLLLQKGTLQAKQVSHRITRENANFIGLKGEEVRKQIDQFGYYDVVDEQPKEILDSLDSLVSLGYLDKKIDKMYNVGFY